MIVCPAGYRVAANFFRCRNLSPPFQLRAWCFLAVALTAVATRAPGAEPPKVLASDAAAQSHSLTATSMYHRMDLIVVGEDQPWMAALATPLAGKLRRSGGDPLLLAVAYPPSDRSDWLLTRVAPRRTIILSACDSPHLGPLLPTLSPEILPLGIDPIYGSLALARRFWKRTRLAVVAPANDLEGILLGAALAETVDAPLLIRDRGESRAALLAAVQELGVKEVLLAVSEPQRAPRWARQPDDRVQVLTRRDIQDRLIARLGAGRIRTIVLARAPDQSVCAGVTSWLAPYVCAARGAPLVLCHSDVTRQAEAEVTAFLDRYHLRPRTITILADYASIGTELVEIDAQAADAVQPSAAADDNRHAPPGEKKKYQVAREPCVPADPAQAIAVGVGRIPSESLAEASLLFVRGLVRERLSAGQPGRLLMIANPSLNRRPLPLCETISRITAEEFRNYRIPLDEYYGIAADSPEVRAAATRASLVIYEGHVSYQDLFDVHYGRPIVPDENYEEALDALESRTPDAAAEPPPAQTPQPPARPLPPPPRYQGRLEEPLPEFPIAILQSCESLDELLLDRVDELGCAAVVGSVTNIHSGSGSMLVQALSSALIQNGDTIGESLRDAQNYLFCLDDLKIQRGLKDQAKSHRVAISFRLWGDPELPVFSEVSRHPRANVVAARWTGPTEITIQVPARHAPEARSAGYYARVFPGSQSAGLVKKRTGQTVRRVLPAYYFRLPLPDGFPAAATRAQISAGALGQAAIRLDPLGRLAYVVYLPDVERANETIVLRWTKAGAGSSKE
jgi:hypothetical protein